jgi:acetolactate synthase I/II/III large subunit
MYVAVMGEMHGHAGEQTIAAVRSTGTDVMFTLNGGHIWPFYEAARNQGMRVVDTRHEQTATFAAEAYSKLTRQPGLAVLTAGPGITNGVSAVTSAHFNGSPLLVLGGRAPARRWGAGSLQELDHVPILASVTKSSATITEPDSAGAEIVAALHEAMTPHRGPVFRDFPLDVFGPASAVVPDLPAGFGRGATPDPAAVEMLAAAICSAQRPAFMIGSDVYFDGAEAELQAATEHLRVPCFFNGLGRGMLAADHELAFLRTRSLLKERADLVVVFGTPLDFRLGFGRFGDAEVIHVVDAESQRAQHVEVPTVVGDQRQIMAGIAAYSRSDLSASRARHDDWIEELRSSEAGVAQSEEALLRAGGTVISPGRIYGELRSRLARDAVVICDGGDFASYAGKLVEVQQPGCWLDTGPYGCLGNGLGYAIAARVVRPSSQVVVLLGDGAAGFSLMDVDSLVRHNLPVVMVVGNNGMWGLEKHPMQAIYGWDVACDLQPGCRYDEVVRALGGDGETVTDPEQVGPALDRAFASGVPYLVNVITDPTDVYPRTSNLA